MLNKPKNGRDGWVRDEDRIEKRERQVGRDRHKKEERD